MKKNNDGKIKKWLLLIIITTLSLLNSTLAFSESFSRDDSQERLRDLLQTVGKGWQVKSRGGLEYMNPEDKRFWFSLGGALRFDETYFSGRWQDRAPIVVPNNSSRGVGFPSGGNVRKVEIDLVGGISDCWNYNISLEFGTDTGTRFNFADTWVSYSGLYDNVVVYFGRHSVNWFGLENSTSTSWYPFLERSPMASAFYPGDGIGLLVDAYTECTGFTFLAVLPDHGPRGSNQRLNSDDWLYLARGTFAPIHDTGDVWHVGAAAIYHHDRVVRNDQGVLASDLIFRSRPSSRARNTDYSITTGPLAVNDVTQVCVEAARQCGPLIVQADYARAFAHPVNRRWNKTFPMDGANVQVQYMLTGEIQKYDVIDGSFGGFDVCSPCGAFEIAARYGYANLNNKFVRGGLEHDAVVGLNWYPNNNLRLAFNYVNATIHPPLDAPKRRLNIFAARLQVKFK